MNADIIAPHLPDPDPAPIAGDDWRLVREFIDTVADEERQREFVSAACTWRTVVVAFRKVECNRMRLAEAGPDDLRWHRMRLAEAGPDDLRWHRMCLAGLIAVGEVLVAKLGEIQGDQILEAARITKADVEATVRVLQDNWGEWHAEVNPGRVKNIQSQLRLADATA